MPGQKLQAGIITPLVRKIIQVRDAQNLLQLPNDLAEQIEPAAGSPCSRRKRQFSISRRIYRMLKIARRDIRDGHVRARAALQRYNAAEYAPHLSDCRHASHRSNVDQVNNKQFSWDEKHRFVTRTGHCFSTFEFFRSASTSPYTAIK